MGKKYIRKTQEIEEQKFDPLNVLPQEILDKIFGYLGVKDLLNLSLSSLNWCNTIAKSECINKRAKLVIQTEILDSNMVKILKSSIREYQNIYIYHPCEIEISTDSKKDINAILTKFCNSIKSLETPFDIARVCDMPKLRKLVLNSYENRPIKYFVTGFFSKLGLIEELHIKHPRWSDKFKKHLKDTLPTMKHLKLLRVSKNILSDVQYSFRLRKFECYGLFKDEYWMNMVKFLKSQSASLEALFIKLSRSDNDIDEVLSIILAMPNLNELTLRSNSYSMNVSARLPINNTIKSLTCDVNFAILAFLENLQVLRVDMFTSSLLNAIPTCPSLRQVQYRHLNYGLLTDYMTTVRHQHPNIEFIQNYYYYESYY